MVQIFILQTLPCTCYIETPMDILLKTVNDSSKPPPSVPVHLPPFWKGFGKQASKCKINYHKSSFYRIQMTCEIPELLIQDIQNIINSYFTDITICMLHTREMTYCPCTSEVIKTTYQRCNICAKFARTVKKTQKNYWTAGTSLIQTFCS